MGLIARLLFIDRYPSYISFNKCHCRFTKYHPRYNGFAKSHKKKWFV